MKNLNAQQIIKALEEMNMLGVSPIAIKNGIALIKELTEVAERREDIEKSPVDCSTPSVTELQRENERLHASYTELAQKCASLTEENERLRTELEQRPPKLIITRKA